MRCYECRGEFVEHTGSLTLNDDIVGKFTVDNITYKKCDKCGELAFPAGVSTIIEGVKKAKLRKLIGRLPVDEFITAAEVANMLNISRQAIHKHRRISRGFVHSITHGGRILYHKKSVELFRDTGDGRFPLLGGKPESTSWGIYRVITGGKKHKEQVRQTWETTRIEPDEITVEGLG